MRKLLAIAATVLPVCTICMIVAFNWTNRVVSKHRTNAIKVLQLNVSRAASQCASSENFISQGYAFTFVFAHCTMQPDGHAVYSSAGLTAEPIDSKNDMWYYDDMTGVVRWKEGSMAGHLARAVSEISTGAKPSVGNQP